MGHYPINGKNIIEMAQQMQADLDTTKRVLIQPDYGKHRSPSVIYRVNGGVHQLSPLSSQILDSDRSHIGNLNPGMKLADNLESVIEEKSKRIFEAARNMGFKGEGGLDWMIPEEYGELPAEINARPTGNTAPAFVHNRFSSNCSVYGSSFNVISPSIRTFDQVRVALDRLLISDKGATSGIMPIQTGDLHSRGKMVVVALGESAEESLRIARNGADRLGDNNVKQYLMEESIN